MKKRLTLEDKKQIQLQMLVEIDEFCRVHDIRYSLAYGTLIGAIRHKGFIPWDDDVDIMMPLPDMLKFRDIFKSDTMRYCDVDNDSSHLYAFSRITHKGTYCKEGCINTEYGVCIDLYPVLGLPDTKEEISTFFQLASCELRRRLRFMRIRNRILKVFPIRYIPGFNAAMKRYRDFLFQFSYENTKYYFTNGGELEMRNVHNFDLFRYCIEVSFEGYNFLAIADYDECLRNFYGDYMQLPPEEERVPYHGGAYYWK